MSVYLPFCVNWPYMWSLPIGIIRGSYNKGHKITRNWGLVNSFNKPTSAHFWMEDNFFFNTRRYLGTNTPDVRPCGKGFGVPKNRTVWGQNSIIPLFEFLICLFALIIFSIAVIYAYLPSLTCFEYKYYLYK